MIPLIDMLKTCFERLLQIVYNGYTSHGPQKVMTYYDVSVHVRVSVTLRNLSTIIPNSTTQRFGLFLTRLTVYFQVVTSQVI